jgi:hypothetical protein
MGHDLPPWEDELSSASILARLCTCFSLANECSELLLRRKELLKSLGKPAEKKYDGPAVLFQRHLNQPDVEKVGGGEAPCIPHHVQTA